MTVLYGIKNCDTVKKARRWLDGHGVDYRFHDFRADGLDRALLERFEAALGCGKRCSTAKAPPGASWTTQPKAMWTAPKRWS